MDIADELTQMLEQGPGPNLKDNFRVVFLTANVKQACGSSPAGCVRDIGTNQHCMIGLKLL